MKILYLLIILFSIRLSKNCFCQSNFKNYTDPELIKRWGGKLPSWQNLYDKYVNSDSNATLIKFDSILVSYLAHPNNSTNYAMPISYNLSTKSAISEMDKYISILYVNLGKKDSVNFRNSQFVWREHFNRESEFKKKALMGYANYSKYGHEREVMIHNAPDRYRMIKEWILTIQYYIQLSENYEETNDD